MIYIPTDKLTIQLYYHPSKLRTMQPIPTSIDGLNSIDLTNWTLEQKFDGDRCIVYPNPETNTVECWSRNRGERDGRQFPDTRIHNILTELALQKVREVYDGELLREHGKELLVIFDVISKNDHPLSERQEVLRNQLTSTEHVKTIFDFAIPSELQTPALAFDYAVNQGQEGIIAKDLSSLYYFKQHPAWYKVRKEKVKSEV